MSKIIAIHNSKVGFHPRWIRYCEENEIPFKIVNCYANDIVDQLKDCYALMWHHSQGNPRDILIAKQILFALQQNHFKVFPNFNTGWHFDDKVAQKYLLESMRVEFAPTWVFFSYEEVVNWLNSTTFPKVFKLRGGAGSQNVKLVSTMDEALKLAKIAFSKGFSNYDAWGNIKERYRKYKLGKTTVFDLVKGAIRFVKPPLYARTLGKEVGYIYFQEFYPNNNSDTRIVVIANKAFGLKRMVRKNDFRASGSGEIIYSKNEIDERCVKLALNTSKRLDTQCIAYDYVFDANNLPKLIEISYGFHAASYDACEGFWDQDMNWHEDKFNPYGWMVDCTMDNLVI